MTAQETIEDIKAHPETHAYSFEDLTRCCTIDGVFDTRVMEAHSDYVDLGSNGGVQCDTTCACGAWH